jgi:hypothetical protein
MRNSFIGEKIDIMHSQKSPKHVDCSGISKIIGFRSREKIFDSDDISDGIGREESEGVKEGFVGAENV